MGSNNTFKTVLLLTALTVILILGGRLIAGTSGMIVMFVLALGMNFVSYWFSDKIALMMAGARGGSRPRARARSESRHADHDGDRGARGCHHDAGAYGPVGAHFWRLWRPERRSRRRWNRRPHRGLAHDHSRPHRGDPDPARDLPLSGVRGRRDRRPDLG